MIEFILAEPQEGEPEGTVLCLEVRYGGMFDTDRHIPLLRLGIVPMTMFPKRGWVWLSLLNAPRHLFLAREALRRFWSFCDWDLIATAKPGRDARFAEFCGFRRVGEHEGSVILERVK